MSWMNWKSWMTDTTFFFLTAPGGLVLANMAI